MLVASFRHNLPVSACSDGITALSLYTTPPADLKMPGFIMAQEEPKSAHVELDAGKNIMMLRRHSL